MGKERNIEKKEEKSEEEMLKLDWSVTWTVNRVMDNVGEWRSLAPRCKQQTIRSM